MVSKKKGKDKMLKIWRWNCQSIQRKTQNLLQFTCSHQLDVIALQETAANELKLCSYETHIAEVRRMAILMKKQHTMQQHYINWNRTYPRRSNTGSEDTPVPLYTKRAQSAV